MFGIFGTKSTVSCTTLSEVDLRKANADIVKQILKNAARTNICRFRKSRCTDVERVVDPIHKSENLFDERVK